MVNTAYILQKVVNTFKIMGIIYDVTDINEVLFKLFQDSLDIVYDDYNENFMSVSTIIFYNNNYYKINDNSIDVVNVKEILANNVTIDFNTVLNTTNNDNEDTDYEGVY